MQAPLLFQEQRGEAQILSQVLPITQLSDTEGLGCHIGFRNSPLIPTLMYFCLPMLPPFPSLLP